MTTPTQMRLTDSDKAKIMTVREWYGLPSATATVRLTLDLVHRLGPPGEGWGQWQKNPRTNQKMA